MIKEITKNNKEKIKIIGHIWTAFLHLLEKCHRSDYKLLVTEVLKTHEGEVKAAEARMQVTIDQEVANVKAVKE